MNLRPSSLPILAKSPKFVSCETSFTEEGTDRHDALRMHFEGSDGLLDLLDEESAGGVRWAADYIRLKAPLSDYPLEWEVEMPIIYPDFSEQRGHADAVCNLDIFDLKSRERDYGLQMAAYALGRLQELNATNEVIVRCHLLFTATKRCEVLTFDTETAYKALRSAIDEINAAVECRPSEYCGWCANRVTCDVLNKRAQAVAAGREDWELEQYHASKISEPGEMAKALTLARQLKAWIEGIEFHAREMAIKQGLQIPGYTLKQRNGKKFCFDIQGAFTASGLDAPTFLQCCDLRFSSSKKNPNKHGLENVYHKAASLPSLAAAKRELKSKLAPFVKTGEPSLYLASEKATETSQDEE
jgi:hypothetical protein